jgi:hypothetical protein
MFLKTKELQLIIKGQYINNSNFVKPAIYLHTYEIQLLMLIYAMIFPTQHLQKMIVFKFMHTPKMFDTRAYLVTLPE